MNDFYVFEFQDYKDYLLKHVGPRTQRRGVKSAMAKAIGCQPTYISQVLHGSADLSLEQAERLGIHLQHTQEEQHFFLLLVQKARAGTHSLRAYFGQQIQDVLGRRLILTERLGRQNSLSKEDQSTYYSSWHYAAVHIALTIPELRSQKALASYFSISVQRVSAVIEFLLKTGLAQMTPQGLSAGTATIRLGNDSHNIIKHHTHWRNQAIQSLERESLRDLHYSAVFSMSKEDATRIKDRFLESIRENISIVKESKEEEVYTCCIDFFRLGQNSE